MKRPASGQKSLGAKGFVLFVLLFVLGILSICLGEFSYGEHGFPHATVKVWDTAAPIGGITLGLTPGESVEDTDGMTGHGTSFPSIVTVYARGSHPLGPSGVAYWNPDGNVFVWYGKTFGFPGGIDINRGSPVLQDPVAGISFGPGDVWIGGQQQEPVYVHLAGTDKFRTYGTSGPLIPPSGRVWGLEVDEATGNVFIAQPGEVRVSRVHPPNGLVTMWDLRFACNGQACGVPVYVTLDAAGRPYTTLFLSDGILRVNPGADGVLGLVNGFSDDTITFWKVPSLDGRSSFRDPSTVPTDEENPNGILISDSAGNVWFTETNSDEVGRLSGGPNGVLGDADDEICEYTKAGLLNPQQIASSGSGNLIQIYFTEGDGNSVSVLTPVEADRLGSGVRVCTTVPPLTFAFPPDGVREVFTRMFDEEVSPLRTAIIPTVHDVPGLDGSASGTTFTAGGEPIPPILRFSPMPNPILSAEGIPIGDAGNGFPSGMTGVYAQSRVAGTYLKGNKHFEVSSAAVIAPPSPPDGETEVSTGRMTGGGWLPTGDGIRVTHGFVLHCVPAQKKGMDVVQVNWGQGGGNRFHLLTLDSASCSDDPAIHADAPATNFDTHTGWGTGSYNGVDGATAEWTFTDAGEPGTYDTTSLTIKDSFGVTVLEVSGPLAGGNHQAKTPE